MGHSPPGKIFVRKPPKELAPAPIIRGKLVSFVRAKRPWPTAPWHWGLLAPVLGQVEGVPAAGSGPFVGKPRIPGARRAVL